MDGLIQPVLLFDTYGIAIHYLLRKRSPTSKQLLYSEPQFESLERDLLATVYREQRLRVDGQQAVRTERQFGSRSLPMPPDWRELEIAYNERLDYEAEAKVNPLFPPDSDRHTGAWPPHELTKGKRVRAVRCLPSLTEFSSGVVIVHLVFVPIADNSGQTIPESLLNEWDLTALSKLWQGGEGVGSGSGQHELMEKLRFSPRHAGQTRTFTLNDLACEIVSRIPGLRDGELFHDDFAFEPRAGTFELTLDDDHPTAGIYTWLKLLKQKKATLPTPLPEKVVAVEGVLCGLLDYFDVGANEIEDVFADPIAAEDDCFIDIHKGTLLYLSRTNRRPTCQSDCPVGVSPYFLLPQSVLLQNEYWLQWASHQANKLNAEQTIRETEQIERDVRQALPKNRLPNLFHYRTERSLYDDGHRARGLNDLAQHVNLQLGNVVGKLTDLRANHERENAMYFGFLGIAIAMAQVLTGWNGSVGFREAPGRWIIALGGGALFGVWIWRRNKLK